MTSTRTSTRFLTGGLAAVAVASTVTLTSPAVAADRPHAPCGQPAVAATYTTVFYEQVVRHVAPVTHEEWSWERVVTTYEHEFSKVLAPATSESAWTRQLPTTTEHLWSRKVIDREAVPAVPEVPEVGHFELDVIEPGDTVGLVEYVQQQTGRTRLEGADWNGEKDGDDNGKGWTRTGRGQVWVVDQAHVPGTPALPELSHTETTWSLASPGAGWTGPVDTRVLGGGTESTTTTGDDVPAGSGWVKQSTTAVPPVIDTLWAVAAPAGYGPTGSSRVLGQATETSPGASAAAPAGDGWTKVAGSVTTVTDVEGYTEVLSPGRSETVELTPAVPATGPCVAAPTTDVAGPTAPHEVVGDASGDAGGNAAAGPTTTVLPATGSPVSGVLAMSGIGALLAGSVLVRTARRRRTS